MKTPGNRRRAAVACAVCKVTKRKHEKVDPDAKTEYIPCWKGCTHVKPGKPRRH